MVATSTIASKRLVAARVHAARRWLSASPTLPLALAQEPVHPTAPGAGGGRNILFIYSDPRSMRMRTRMQLKGCLRDLHELSASTMNPSKIQSQSMLCKQVSLEFFRGAAPPSGATFFNRIRKETRGDACQAGAKRRLLTTRRQGTALMQQVLPGLPVRLSVQ